MKLKIIIYPIEKSPYLSRKRNLSLNSRKCLNNSPSPKKKLFKIDSVDNNQIESNDNLTGKSTDFNRPFLKKGKWSQEEDNLLIKYISRFGVGKWNKIEKLFIGRTRKQIRQRYINNYKIKKLSEELNQNITYNSAYSSDEEENEDKVKPFQNGKDEKFMFKWDEKLDKILLKEYLLNKKCWVKISKKIQGSSENSVKNRFYSLLRQKVNKIKKEYKYIKNSKEISGNNNNMNNDIKYFLFNNCCFDSEFLNNKSKKKNYSVEFLLEFLPQLLEEKGININEILNELKERKNIAAKNIFFVIEKHIDSYKNLENDDFCSISTDIEFDNLLNLKSEKLGHVIKNMKLRIIHKYFHRFKYNTLGK